MMMLRNKVCCTGLEGEAIATAWPLGKGLNQGELLPRAWSMNIL
jgi:hypothetical protein